MMHRLIGVFLIALFLAACSGAPPKKMDSMKSAGPVAELPEIAPYDDPPMPPLDVASEFPDAK